MKHCDPCGIDITGDLDECPLCQSKLTGEAVPSVFPRNLTKKSGSMALKVLAFVTGVSLLLLIFLWQIDVIPGDYILTACVALILNYLFIRNILLHRPDFLRVVVRYFLILLAIAAVWFLLTWNPIITTYVIPGICLVAIVFDTILLAIFRSTFVAGYAKYLLFDILLGLAPLVLVALNLTTWNLLPYISALTASVFFLALIVFMHKQLVAEIRKLFSA